MRFVIIFFIQISFVLSLSGQKLNLTLLAESIVIKNNRLYLKFEISNESNKTFVLYDIKFSDFTESIFTDSMLNIGVQSNEYWPRLMLIVRNEKNQFCEYVNSDVPPSYLNPKDKKLALKAAAKFKIIMRRKMGNRGKFFIIEPEKPKIFTINENMSKLALKAGTYSLQLVYLSSNFYFKEFTKLIKDDSTFKDYIFYNGYLKSNICIFDYK